MSAILRRSANLRKLYASSCQVLRFTNCKKVFRLVTEAPEIQQCAYGSNVVFQRNLAKVAPKYENGEEQSAVSEEIPADLSIDQTLSKIDADARRFGYVVRKDVEGVLNRIKEFGVVSSIQGLYLIRCCGSLLCYESPAKRIALVQEIWDELQKFGTPLDASHYNALLKSYLENEHTFSPSEFLAEMEQKGISPNRVTYQRIIEKYCNDGDLNGASAILEHMKEKDLPINESIFNCLVRGHAQAKDLQGAVNMLDVMRKSKLEPTPDTYAALACGFAENGDMEGFHNTLREAEEKQLFFSDKNHLQMISSLASSGNIEFMDEVIARIDIHQHRPEVMNTVLMLVSRGFDDAAYKIMLSVLQTGTGKVFFVFVRALLANEQSSEKILTYCQDVFNKGIHEFVYEDVVKSMLLYGKADRAFELFAEMKKVGRPLRCHYFWPIFSTFGKRGDVEGVWRTLKFMSDMAVPADQDTYVDFVLPHVTTCCNPEEIISKIKEIGQSDAVATDTLFSYFCNSGQLSKAADFYEKFKPCYNLSSFANNLASTAYDDIESVVRLLKQLSAGHPDPDSKHDIFGIFLQRLLVHHRNNMLVQERFIREYEIQNVKLPTAYVQLLCSQLKIFAPELVRLVQNLEINVIRDQFIDIDFVRPADMTLEQVEEHLKLVKERGGNVRPLLRHLLTVYCRSKDLTRVLEIKAELDAINFTYSPTAYALLINLFVSHNNLEEAMKYKKLIDEQYPHFKLEVSKAINYIALMIKCDKIDEAFDVIEKEAKDWLPPRYDDLRTTSVKQLLHVAAETGNVEITQKLFQVFVQDLKFAPMHYTVLEPLIKVHLVRNDTDAAIEEFRMCVANHNVYPSRNFLFKKFIAVKDPERLQKVVDICTEHGARDVALHELAAAFTDSGCVQEARKVIQTLGTKADQRILDMICYRFFKQERVQELEQFVGITKDLFHVDRNMLYEHLLNSYALNNNFGSALEMWNNMQEENVQPSTSILLRLADLLQKNDQPVPFVVPHHSLVQSNSFLIDCLAEKNEIQVIGVLQKMRKGEIHALNPETFTEIVDLMVQKKCLKEIVDIVQVMSAILAKPSQILKPVASKYGQAGDIDAMKLIHDCFPDFAHKHMNFNTYFFEAYLVSGQPEALINELEKNIGSAGKLFSVNGFLKLLQTCPEHFDRALELVDAYEKEDFIIPRMVLWTHYFLQEKYEEANEIYKKNPIAITKSDIPFMKIIQAVMETQNENLGRKLVDLANDTLKENIMIRAYNCFLNVLVQNEKLEDAVKLVEEAKSHGLSVESLLPASLANLKKSLVEKNMHVPFVIQFEGAESGSSSSDDSD